MTDAMMREFSICIPSYNRAEMLRLCLDHLAASAHLGFEVVIGDNASPDHTQTVVHEFADRFPHFQYLRHATNIGFARNMDSVLRRATRKYLYILSDDDIVFIEALRLAGTILDSNPDVVAVVGKYLSLRQLDVAIGMNYDDATASIIHQGAYQALLDNMYVCDGHPILRRELFIRHLTYLDRTGTLTPLYFNLLRHGKIVVVDRPFFQHLTNSESLTTRMAEPSFLDMVNADLELALVDCDGLRPNALETARRDFLRLIYFQATRMSLGRGDYYLVWLFLRRMAAIDPTSEPLMLRAETEFIHDFLVQRLAALIRDGQYDVCRFAPTPRVLQLLPGLRRAVPSVEFRTESPVADLLVFYLDDEGSDLAAGGRPGIALEDLCGQCRLTRRAAHLSEKGGRLTLTFADEDVDRLAFAAGPNFDVLRAPYSETRA